LAHGALPDYVDAELPRGLDAARVDGFPEFVRCAFGHDGDLLARSDAASRRITRDAGGRLSIASAGHRQHAPERKNQAPPPHHGGYETRSSARCQAARRAQPVPRMPAFGYTAALRWRTCLRIDRGGFMKQRIALFWPGDAR